MIFLLQLEANSDDGPINLVVVVVFSGFLEQLNNTAHNGVM